MKQTILTAKDNYKELDRYIEDNNINNIFVVCLKSIKELDIYNYLESLNGIKVTYFSNFNPNPTYESVLEGIKEFKNSGSKNIFAIGGGSAIDVAKCIKLFSTLDSGKNYLSQELESNNIELLAVPTTAGTGSEATKYAVIYYNGIKQSITHNSSIPSVVLFDSSLLETLPIYQKKSTVLDAFCHSIESMWSVNSNNESKKYAIEAVKLIVNNLDRYLAGDNGVNEIMFEASNLAGKAINITQTTAGHAMCYKLTSLYGISHGHAAALINSELLPFMLDNIDNCSDGRGSKYLLSTFKEISDSLKLSSVVMLGDYIRKMLEKLDLYDVKITIDDIDVLVDSVNATRLKNNPVKLSSDDIKNIYLNLINNIEKRKKNGSKRVN